MAFWGIGVGSFFNAAGLALCSDPTAPGLPGNETTSSGAMCPSCRGNSPAEHVIAAAAAATPEKETALRTLGLSFQDSPKSLDLPARPRTTDSGPSAEQPRS